MTGRAYEGVSRTLRLTRDVRLDGDLFVIGVRVFRGAVPIATEEVFVPVDDASVLNAQLTHLLNERAFPGLDARERERARDRWRC